MDCFLLTDWLYSSISASSQIEKYGLCANWMPSCTIELHLGPSGLVNQCGYKSALVLFNSS